MKMSSNWEGLRIENVFEMREPQTEKVFKLRGSHLQLRTETISPEKVTFLNSSAVGEFRVWPISLFKVTLERQNEREIDVCFPWHHTMQRWERLIPREGEKKTISGVRMRCKFPTSPPNSKPPFEMGQNSRPPLFIIQTRHQELLCSTFYVEREGERMSVLV